MKIGTHKAIHGLAVAALLLGAVPASAALLDRGPQDPTLVFPQWYRDLNGTALGLCTSQLPSPNALAGGAPMCFPIVTDPAGFAGNLGDEIFYSNLSVNVQGSNAFTLLYEAALEAAYAEKEADGRPRVVLPPPDGTAWREVESEAGARQGILNERDLALQAELDDKIAAADAWSLDRNVEIAMDALRCPADDADANQMPR